MKLNEAFQSNILRGIADSLKADYNNKLESADFLKSEVSELMKKLWHGKMNADAFAKALNEVLWKNEKEHTLSPSFRESKEGTHYYRKDGRKLSFDEYKCRRIEGAALSVNDTTFNGKGDQRWNGPYYYYNDFAEEVQDFIKLHNSKERDNGVFYSNSANNSFSIVFDRIWNYRSFDKITDDDFEKVTKIPKVITEKNKYYNYRLFWLNSDTPESDTVDKGDRLIAITYGSRINWCAFSSGILGSKNKNSSVCIKDIVELLGENKLKIFALKENPDDAKEVSQKRRERAETQKGTYSNNIYIRDEQYKEKITEQVRRYKTIIENNKALGDNQIDNDINKVLEKIGDFIKNGISKNTSILRRISSKTNTMLEKYESTMSHKSNLLKSYDDYEKRWYLQYKSEMYAVLKEIEQLIDNTK